MKKFIGLCIITSLVLFVAFGLSKKNLQVTDPPIVISTADLATFALMHTKKVCVPISELALLKQLRDAQAELYRLANCCGKEPTSTIRLYAAKMCPCPGGSGLCSCDSTMYRTYAALETWNTELALVGTKPKRDILKLSKLARMDGIATYELPDKLEDGDYTLVIRGGFGGGDPAPKPFELPVSIQKGKMYQKR